MATLVTDDDIQEWLNQLEDLNLALFESTEELTKAEEDRKIMKSILMKEYEDKFFKENNKQLSANLQERDAYADPRYREVSERYAISKAKTVYIGQKLKQFDARYNIWRTESANLRAVDRL